MIQFLKNRRAFTLIELIIVIGVIAVLVVIGAESFKKSREQLAFENTVNRVVELMQKARTLAINSALYKGTEYDSNADWKEVVPSGYGVRITRPHSDGSDEQAKGYGGTVTLFVDNRYTGTAGCDDLEIQSSDYQGTLTIPLVCFSTTAFIPTSGTEDVTLETYEIPSDIVVRLNAMYGITIIFSPPFADVKMYKDFYTTKTDFSKQDNAAQDPSLYELDQNTAMIFLTSRLNANTKQKIFFNRFGGVPELAKE